MALDSVSITTQIMNSALLSFGDDVKGFTRPDPAVALSEKDLKKKVTVSFGDISKEFLRVLLNERGLTAAQKKAISVSLGTLDELLDTPTKDPKELHYVLNAIMERSIFAPRWLEMIVGKSWYPVNVSLGYQMSYYKKDSGSVVMNFGFIVCDFVSQKREYIDEEDFRDDSDRHITRTAREILEKYSLRVSTEQTFEEFSAKSSRAAKIRSRPGLCLDMTGDALISMHGFFGPRLASVRMGSKKYPIRLLVESELEATREYDEDDTGVILPFVRCWSATHKAFVYADVTDVVEHQFNTDPRGKLVLPQPMRMVLDSVFDPDPNAEIFGDMFAGRHGGIVILANGPSGVGKTLTAEVYAEYTKRPLYILEMGELGTSLDSVEENLKKIFLRAARWNAILLFDEADIFLARRQETDLERSAIVGVFLRLLDQYEGTFFLTTNRAEVIDPAFKSRITLKIDYPDLVDESRRKIWKMMLEAAKFDVEESGLDEVAAHKINGRQIRNQVRLLGKMYPDRKATAKQIKESMQYVAMLVSQL